MPSDSPYATGLFTLLMLTSAKDAAANATIAYRCQQAGQTVYQAEPCANGQQLNLDDRRTEEQRRASVEAVSRDAATADQVAASNAKRWQQLQWENRALGRYAAGRVAPGSATRAQVKLEQDTPRRARKKPFTVRLAAPKAPQGPERPSGKKSGR